MTVKELIEKLKKCDQEEVPYCYIDEGYWAPISSVCMLKITEDLGDILVIHSIKDSLYKDKRRIKEII